MKSLLVVFLLLFANVNLQAQQYYQVATETLNVRSSPSGNSSVISQFAMNDSVQVVSRGGKWSKIALEDGRFGYVASKFISEEFNEHRQGIISKSATSSSSGSSGSSGWGFWIVGGIVLLYSVFKSSSSSKKASPKSGKSQISPQRTATASPKPAANEDITEVRLESNWYKVYNSDGKHLADKHKGNNISLAGYSSKLIVMEENQWFRLYNFQFKQIAVKHVSAGDRVLSVSMNTITIQEGTWVRTYDTTFKQINVRSAK